jgi:hypothetical protein
MRRDAEVDAAAPKGAISMSVIARLAIIHATIQWAAVTELSALEPPSSLARDWQRLLAYRRTLAGQLDKVAQYARRSDTAGIHSFVVASEDVKRQLLATTRDGFRYCSRVE